MPFSVYAHHAQTIYTLIVSSTLQSCMLSVYKAMNVHRQTVWYNGVTGYIVSPFTMSIALAYWNAGGNCGFIIQIAHERVSLISFDHFVFYERFSFKVKAVCSRKACILSVFICHDWLIKHFLSAFRRCYRVNCMRKSSSQFKFPNGCILWKKFFYLENIWNLTKMVLILCNYIFKCIQSLRNSTKL